MKQKEKQKPRKIYSVSDKYRYCKQCRDSQYRSIGEFLKRPHQEDLNIEKSGFCK